MRARILHGLLQKAMRDADALRDQLQIGKDGFTLYQRQPIGWKKVGEIYDRQLAEDLLVSQLRPVTREDR